MQSEGETSSTRVYPAKNAKTTNENSHGVKRARSVKYKRLCSKKCKDGKTQQKAAMKLYFEKRTGSYIS